ncbi:MAG TPA: hypothetical protein VFY05_10865 [Candidatus Angelobacter sp.]|nr:hypothetical protein [Candidatus Angelobacter sp.]
MEPRRDTILWVTDDHERTNEGRRLLQSAGLHVVVITRAEEIPSACKEHRPKILLIGASVNPAEKRHIWAAARKSCNTTLVELGRDGVPEVAQMSYFVDPEPPNEVVRRLKQIMRVRP